MPLYELLCLVRPSLPRDALQRVIKKVGNVVYDSGGVVTNFLSYGEQQLAYRIRGVSGKHEQVCCLVCGWRESRRRDRADKSRARACQRAGAGAWGGKRLLSH
jgi:hypothetical protein